MYSMDQKHSDDGPLLAAQRRFGITLSLSGNPDLLDLSRRMFLVSRANYTPRPDSPWLRALISAAEQAAALGEVLVCGCERLGYDIPRQIFARNARNGVILVKHRSEITPPLPANALIVEFETIDRRDPLPLRDQLVAHFASAATEILLRNEGNMARIAKSFHERHAPIDTSFRVKDEESPRARWPQINLAPLPFPAWDFLTHFTREPDGAWPDETQEEFVQWLCSAAVYERRDDFSTLRRILSQRKILGSGRFIRGGTPAVCWTALPPHAVANLRDWRKGLRRWNFTPYGIAIRRSVLEQRGARAVRYSLENEMAAAHPDDAPCMQLANSGAYDWTLEKEWRTRGDLDLTTLPTSDVIVLTHSQTEAATIEKEFRVQAFATG